MDLGNYKSQIGGSIFVIAALSYILSSGLLVNGSSATMKDVELSQRKGTVKTIETEDGDVDCVDIYKQPTFNHPLLKNHTIQMKPSSFPKGTSMEDPKLNASQSWVNIVYCPEGTVPIARTKISDHHRPISFIAKENQNNASVVFAQVRMSSGIYMGAEAVINVWNPKTVDGDYSSAQIWLVSGERLFKRMLYKPAGWFKHQIGRQGFVQTTRAYFIGAAAHSVSKYRGKQYEAKISIHKDMVTGNWWLRIMDQVIGYWPGSIFTGLSKSSKFIYWGGEVGTDDYLTKTTEMGSGHFPSEGWERASYFRSLGYVDSGGFMQEANHLISRVMNPSRYNVIVPSLRIKYYGTYFYFGGPGHRLLKQNKVAR